MPNSSIARRSIVHNLYVAELTDLCRAEDQLLLELPLLAARATAAPLRQLFEYSYCQTREHADRVRQVLDALDERLRPSQQPQGLRGIIHEGQSRSAGLAPGDALDASLLAMAQRIAHFEISGYEIASTWAAAIGDTDGEALLRQTLAEEGRVHAMLTRQAAEMAGVAGLSDMHVPPARVAVRRAS